VGDFFVVEVFVPVVFFFVVLRFVVFLVVRLRLFLVLRLTGVFLVVFFLEVELVLGVEVEAVGTSASSCKNTQSNK